MQQHIFKKSKYHVGRGKHLKRFANGWTDNGLEYYQELLMIFKELKSSDVWNTLQDHWKLYQKKLTESKLDQFLSTLFEGLSETANKGKMFDQHVWNEKSKRPFINEIVDIALSATQIPLSLFTNLFYQRFEKHSMLESMLEILQQFYI